MVMVSEHLTPVTARMRAIVQDAYGDAGVPRHERIARLEVADNKVLVQVHAAGLVRGTWHVMTGKPYLMRIAGSGFRVPRRRSGLRLHPGRLRRRQPPVLSPFVGHRLAWLVAKVRSSDLERLTDLIEAGQVTPSIDRTYPLDRVPDAMRHLASGQVRGKAAITI
jgi:NADPH:quinone reductase-like Zn-dependent oxidoreductase